MMTRATTIRHLALIAVVTVAFTAEAAAATWAEWVDDFVTLASDRTMSDVDRLRSVAWLSQIVDVKADPKSACGESFVLDGFSPRVSDVNVFLMTPPGRDCADSRFGMASLGLKTRIVADLDLLRDALVRRFGVPAELHDGEHIDLHWQLTKRRAVELRYPENGNPENGAEPQPAGLTLVNIPF